MTIVAEAPTTVHGGVVDASRPPRRDRAPVVAGAAQALQGAALLIVWIFLYLGVLSDFEHGHDQRELYDQVRTQLALGESATGAPIAPGTPLGVMSIPSIGLHNEVFIEGTRNEQLQRGPGHVYGSVLPGQQGISVLAGRSSTFGAPFGGIATLRRGSVVEVTTANGTFKYRVDAVRTKGDPIPAVPASTSSRLTLVTSLPRSGLLGSIRPADTVFVDATLSSGAVARAPVGTVDPGVTYMSGRMDTSTLAQLALALQALGLAVVGCAWGWRRWSRPAVWVVGTPVIVATSWIVTSLLSRLLPGLV